MRVWQGYGSEHSMNLVLIGRFKEVKDAEYIEELCEKIKTQAEKEDLYSISNAELEDQRFSEKMIKLLQSNRVHTLGPSELEQFISDNRISRSGETLTLTTDESEVSGFIKLFIQRGAKVEVYSAHDYPDE